MQIRLGEVIYIEVRSGSRVPQTKGLHLGLRLDYVQHYVKFIFKADIYRKILFFIFQVYSFVLPLSHFLIFRSPATYYLAKNNKI